MPNEILKRIKNFSQVLQVRGSELAERATFLEKIIEDDVTQVEVLKRSNKHIVGFDPSNAELKLRAMFFFLNELVNDVDQCHADTEVRLKD